MPRFPQTGSTDKNTWGTLLRSFFSPFFNLTTGAFVANSISHTELADKGTNTHTQIDSAVSASTSHIADTNDPHNTTWAQVDKTTSSIADITTKSHTSLTDIGTNTHAQIDTFVTSKAQASGIASLDGSSLVVQNPANATATPTASKIPIADGSGLLSHGWLPMVGMVTMYGNATAPTGWINCDGSSLERTGTYANLFAVIGTTYGAADGTHFSVPDFRGVFPKGAGTTTRAAGVDASGNAYAATLGTYYQDKLQGHNHALDNIVYQRTVYDATGAGNGLTSVSAGSTVYADNVTSPTNDGTNGTPRTDHTTEPQSLGINFIIKY